MKPGRPVLYELMSDGQHVPSNGSATSNGSVRKIVRHTAAPADEHGSLPPPPLIGVGRSVRVPVGYFFIAVAAIIVLAALAYVSGFTKGKSNERSVALDDQQALQETYRITSQLGGSTSGVATAGRGDPAGGRDSGGETSPARVNEQASGQGVDRNRWGAIESDPRKLGLSYFTLIHTSHEGAMRVANFCRENGLEAYVVRVNNDIFRVLVAPGFMREALSSPDATALKQRIADVRTKWKVKVGRDELDPIPLKYTG